MTAPTAENSVESATQDAPTVAVRDWTMGGKKPEREGPRCENPACRQVLMVARGNRRYCALCDQAAGRDAWDHAS